MAAPIPAARSAVQVTFYDAMNQPGVSTNAGFLAVVVRNGVMQLEFGNGSQASVLAIWTQQGWRIAPGSKASGWIYPYFMVFPVVVQ